MKSIIVELIKKFGIKLLLREVAAALSSSKDKNERLLGEDIDVAVKAYERRCGSKKVGA